MQGLTLEQAVTQMKGPINTKIRLKIMRKGAEQPVDIAITREVIRVRPVRFHTEGGDIGYIRITSSTNRPPMACEKPSPTVEAVRRRSWPATSSTCATTPAACSIRRFGIQCVHGARRGGLDPGPHAEETQRFTARAAT